MQLKKIETPAIAHYAYLLADGNEAMIVDPSRDVGRYLDAARELGAQITTIVETHRHEDFVIGSAHLSALTGARIITGDFDTFGHGDLRLNDSDRFELGSLSVKVLHTPGHTPESLCYAVYPQGHKAPWCVFTGDTLFFGDTGRTDLPDADRAVENARLLFQSVHNKLAPLADETFILPAHGPGSVCGSGMAERPMSTLGEEKRCNDVFLLSEEQFAAKKGSERLPRPPYFHHMEQVNLNGGLTPEFTRGATPLLDIDAFCRGAEDGIVIDTREPEAFASAHAAQSYSIWLEGLSAFGGWIADEETPIYLLTDREEDIDQGVQYLARIGIDRVQGGLRGGFATWRASGKPLQSSGVIDPQSLARQLKNVQILDVREPDEFAAGHIPGATNHHVGSLERQIDQVGLDPQQPVVVNCGVGHRAGLGVSILRRHGFESVSNLLGGLKAWRALELPLEEETS